MGIELVTTLLQPGGLRLGTPRSSGSLTVIPVHHRLGAAAYRLHAEAPDVTVEEVSAGGSVPELRVVNPGRVPVLLVEGEVLAGLKQNRTLNTSVLVPAGSTVVVPVTCVEQGRWHATSASGAVDEFHLSPDVREAKVRTTQRHVRSGLGYRSDQGEVWHRVFDSLARHGAASPTASYSEVHRARRFDLGSMLDALRPEEGQAGVLALVGTRPAALDLFDRADTLAALWDALVGSYAADALLEGGVAGDRHVEAAVEWVHGLAAGEATVHPGVAAGEMVQISAPGGVASALVAEGTVVHLAALPRGDQSPPVQPTRPTERGSWFHGGAPRG